jgi:hypothetical protein
MPPPDPSGKPPDESEVDAVLRDLEKHSADVPAPVTTPAPLLAPATEEVRPPPWTEMVTPVLQLRLRPLVRLGFPTSQRRPELQVDTRGWAGAEVRPVEGITARLVVSAHQSFPTLRAPGPDMLLDAWVRWAYPALGGELSFRVGRQDVVLSELLLARNDWLQLPPRFDGVTARLETGHVFVVGVLAAEALTVMPTGTQLPDVNLLALAQSGVQDGEGRVVEMHAAVRGSQVPVHGDRSEGNAGQVRLVVGGNAQWTWHGVQGRAALDLQQEKFEPPSIYAPPLAFHFSGGYAPEVPWMFGGFVEVGVRGAMGQPMTYLPGGVGSFRAFDGVKAQDVEPLYGTGHGAMGEMDLLRLQNAYAVFGRLGLVRDRVRNLSLTFWRLAQWDARGPWLTASQELPMLKAGEGRPDGLIGHEVDLSATAELTRHVVLQGAVGLLYSGGRARDAQFGAFAQTAYAGIEFKL